MRKHYPGHSLSALICDSGTKSFLLLFIGSYFQKTGSSFMFFFLLVFVAVLFAANFLQCTIHFFCTLRNVFLLIEFIRARMWFLNFMVREH